MSTAFRLLTFKRKSSKMSKTFKEMAQEVERRNNQKIEEQEKWVKEMTEELQLKDKECCIPVMRTNAYTLEMEMRALAETKVAASMVGLPILEQTALTALSLANALYKKTKGEYFQLPDVKPEDYLVSAKDLCGQVSETKVKLEDLKIKDSRAAGKSVEGGGVDGSAGGVVEGGGVDGSAGGVVEVGGVDGSAGGVVEGGGVDGSVVGGRGGDESDKSDVESVDVDDRAGARVEASGGDDGAVVAGEVGGGKSGNGGVEVTVVVEESG